MGLLELARQSLAIDRETGNRRSEAITLGTLGASWMGLGDHVQAKRDLEEALRLIRTNGDRSPESTTLINLSQLALWQGEDVRALALANSALETALSAEARDWEAVALLYIGHASLAKLGLNWSFDFRGNSERAATPYQLPGVVQHSLAIEPTVVQRMEAMEAAGRELTEAIVVELMNDLYRSLVNDQASRFAQFFEHLLRAEGPLVFHCTAGKDRTGVAAALVLLALGVSRDQIMDFTNARAIRDVAYVVNAHRLQG